MIGAVWGRIHAGGALGELIRIGSLSAVGYAAPDTLQERCVLTNDREIVHATPNQRVRVPPRQVPERLVAGPRCVERLTWPKRGVESLFGGSKSAGRNIK
jgi:hypothetical protein